MVETRRLILALTVFSWMLRVLGWDHYDDAQSRGGLVSPVISLILLFYSMNF